MDLTSQSQDSVEGMKKLALSAQFDFKYFSDESEMFWAAKQVMESNELQREFSGLDAEKLIDTVMQTPDWPSLGP